MFHSHLRTASLVHQGQLLDCIWSSSGQTRALQHTYLVIETVFFETPKPRLRYVACCHLAQSAIVNVWKILGQISMSVVSQSAVELDGDILKE
jgi:hypothetical protein